MGTLQEMQETARDLREQGKYTEAEAVFGDLWQQHRDELNDWDKWGYAYCLRKLGRSEEALDICRDTYRQSPSFGPNRSLYGWCIYDLEMSKSEEEIKEDPATYMRAAQAILELAPPGPYSPSVRTVFKVVGYLKSRPSYPAEQILEWLDKLDPEELSLEPGQGAGSREYASDREQWYANRCRALYEAGRYKECREAGKQALAGLPGFHYGNDVWIKWRMALSKAEMGDKVDAIYDLRELLPVKKEWFIQLAIARLLHEIGRPDSALKYAVDAALNSGELAKKWEVFLLMGRVFQGQSELEKARDHTLLAVKVREAAGWKGRPELHKMVDELDLDVDVDISASELHNRLRQDWLAVKLSSLPQKRGSVISHEERYGFIRGTDGDEYYFKTRSFQGSPARLRSGLEVEFYVEENPDPDERDVAIQITEVSA